MKIKFFLLIIPFICLIVFFSCKRNNDQPLWNVDVLAPLVQATLSMNNIVKDTSLLKKNPDNSITIVSRQELANLTLDSLVTLNTPPFDKVAKLNSLVLPSRTDTTKITLGQIADSLIANGESGIGNGIKAAAILGIPFDVSTIPPLSLTKLPIDITQFFKQADIATGNLNIKIVNNLPVDMQTLQFNIKNKINQSTIVAQTFNNIAANGGADSISQDLSGMYVEGTLIANLPLLQFNGGSNVVLNLNQSIDVIISINNVSVNSATAVFPDQDIVQYDEDVTLIGMTNGVKLTYAEIESGMLKVDVYSTAQDDVYFTYGIPGAFKSSIPFQALATVPGALPGQTSHKTITYDMSGYSLDLTGQNNDTFNTFFNTLVGRIKYTGKEVTFSLSDSMVISVTTVGLKPSYVRGYLGQNTIDIGPDFTTLDIFKNIESGTLNFENINMNLVIDNGFGLDGSVKINNITASNKANNMVSLTGPNINTPLTIAKATDNPYSNTLNTFDMSTSSNATSLMNILPTKVSYDAQVITNLAGNTGSYTDFAYNTGSLNAYLDIEMPLSLIASQLVLSDTVPFNTASIKKKNINSGTFSVSVSNGFPLNASLKMYFLDANGNLLDSLKSPQGAILAAPVNGVNKVKEKRASHLSFPVNATKMKNLYNTYSVIFKIEFTTEPNATFVKIYSNYSIDFKMAGDMNYSVGKKH